MKKNNSEEWKNNCFNPKTDKTHIISYRKNSIMDRFLGVYRELSKEPCCKRSDSNHSCNCKSNNNT